MLFSLSLNKRPLCQTLSNVFETSQNIMQENIFNTKAFIQTVNVLKQETRVILI